MQIIESIKNNPVRTQSIVLAVLAIVFFYFPALPAVLIVGLVAAIFGTGEIVREKVTPVRKL